MQPLDLLILNATCDDWENLSSIRDSVASSPQSGPVEEAVLKSSLLPLVQQGLLAAYEFKAGNFIRLAPDDISMKAIPHLWYYITQAGRGMLDANEAFFVDSRGATGTRVLSAERPPR